MSDLKGRRPGPVLSLLIRAALTFVLFFVLAFSAKLLSEVSALPFAVCLLLLYLLCLCVYLLLRRVLPGGRREGETDTNRSEGSVIDLVRKLPEPALLCRSDGEIIWYNDAFTAAADSGARSAANAADIVPGIAPLFTAEDSFDREILLGSRSYVVASYLLPAQDQNVTLLLFRDVSELSSLREAYRAEQPVVVYIRIDNLEEMQQYLQDQYRSVEARTNAVIKQWAAGMSGVLREYERNKYLLFITAEALDRCVRNKFSVLDEIREIRVSDFGASVTASIGAARMAGTLAERENAAAEAQKLALERGGDQAVVRTDDAGILYFGGVSQTAHKVTRVRARVFANELCQKISSSDNVLICGHRKIDFDAFGAAVGMARMAFFCGVKTNIIVDTDDPTVRLCMERLTDLPEYEGVFIGEDDALEFVSSETLMIFVDVNNPKLFEAPRVAAAVEKKVFVDHHRKVLDFDFASADTYIEVSASSASELVAEMIEQTLPPRSLLRQEAELLLAGIQLDTKRFTKATGPRTFSAALFLRGAGANPEETRSLFDTELSAMKNEAAFETSAVIYAKHPNIAIACSDTADIICAARVADKLLELRGVDASFTLVPNGDFIHISARSNGKVNVQHIAEKLGGGGRFEEAGAQLSADSLDRAARSLREAIDAYFNELNERKS